MRSVLRKSTGIIVLSIGILIVGFSFFMDTSVATEEGMRVINLGLMHDQTNYLILGGIVAIIGVIVLTRTNPQQS